MDDIIASQIVRKLDKYIQEIGLNESSRMAVLEHIEWAVAEEERDYFDGTKFLHGDEQGDKLRCPIEEHCKYGRIEEVFREVDKDELLFNDPCFRDLMLEADVFGNARFYKMMANWAKSRSRRASSNDQFLFKYLDILHFSEIIEVYGSVDNQKQFTENMKIAYKLLKDLIGNEPNLKKKVGRVKILEGFSQFLTAALSSVEATIRNAKKYIDSSGNNNVFRKPEIQLLRLLRTTRLEVERKQEQSNN